MVLVMTEEGDFSANYVCQWLNHWGVPYKRLNKGDNYNPVSRLRITDNQFEVDFQGWSDVEVSVAWNRRGYHYISGLLTGALLASEASKGIIEHFKDERQTFVDFLYDHVGREHINHPSYYNANKLLALKAATEAGFHVPNSLITQQKADLLAFMEKHPRVITKNIQDFSHFDYAGQSYTQRTVEISKGDLDTIPEKFYYSIFQECVDRRFEIRVFHFMGENHAVAIIFPGDVVDARQVRPDNKVNRIVPFQLPATAEVKINDFMERMELESGSLDIIYDKRGRFYFLEVNPVGQYDYVDKIGHFMLDKKVAQHLKKKEDEFRETV